VCVCVCVCVCLVVSMRPCPKDQAYVPSGLINPRSTPPRRSTGLPRSRDRFRKRTGGLCTWATLRRLARTHISGHHKRVRVRGCAWLRVRACVRACAPVCLRLNGVRACVFARALRERGPKRSLLTSKNALGECHSHSKVNVLRRFLTVNVYSRHSRDYGPLSELRLLYNKPSRTHRPLITNEARPQGQAVNTLRPPFQNTE
jgi:hypothetical protein